MAWIEAGRASKATTAAPPVRSPESLEFATTVSARGIAPANAVIELLNTAECRFRTVVFFDHGDGVEFDLAIQGVGAKVRGSVISRVANGPRFVYRVRLDRMSAKEIDQLAHVVMEIQRKLAKAHHQAIAKIPTTERLTRENVRVLSRFSIVYRTPRSDYRPAKAGNVSAGGLLMMCGEALVQGEPVEVRFTLPSDVLKALPEETAVLDLNKATLTPMRSDQRRPFEEMTLGARVVMCQPAEDGGYRYGLAFTCINDYQREELARYTHAVQRARNRH